MTLTLRYMRLPDIPEVVVIDRLSFDPAWSARSYAYEISESHYSHMVVLEQTAASMHGGGWRRWVKFAPPRTETRTILGYGGLWHIAGEAHISTIATHPQQRGRGYGELLLAGMIRRAITLHAAYVVLEVRVSNLIAQKLYQKYGFDIVAIKRNYYHNNGEDAYDMRLQLEGNAGYIERFAERYQNIIERFHLVDQYSESEPVRR